MIKPHDNLQPLPRSKVKVFELDLGDSKYDALKIHSILNWIELDMRAMSVGVSMGYKITIKLMSLEEAKKLPDWV